MANGTANGPSPVPGWLQPVSQIITTIGIPSLFAVVLLWYVLTKLDSALRVIMENEDARTQKLTRIEATFESSLEKQTAAFNAAILANIAAIDRQTKEFEESLNENTATVKRNADINQQTATAIQRLVNQPPLQGRTVP